MLKPKAPCKNCEQREVGCHGKCEDYIEYRKLQDKVIEARARTRIQKEQWHDYFEDKFKRLSR